MNMYLNWGSLHNKNVTTRHRKPPLKDLRGGPRGLTVHSYMAHWPAQEWKPPAHCLPASTQLSTRSLMWGNRTYLLFCNLTQAPQLEGNEVHFFCCGSIPIPMPKELSLSSLICSFFSLKTCRRPRNQPQMVRQFGLPTNASAGIISGHTHLWTDPQTRNIGTNRTSLAPACLHITTQFPCWGRGKRTIGLWNSTQQ